MAIYDWIIIGAGITGASLAYELNQKGFNVLLLEKDPVPNNATVYSYGGLAYWSGTDDLTRILGKEGIDLHRNLSEELEIETEFRELDLVLTIDRQDDPEIVAQNYDRFAIIPELLSVQDACVLEPLLNPNAIAGALKLPHGHIHPQKTTDAYLIAFKRNGGKIIYQQVLELLRQGDAITGVKTKDGEHYGTNTVVCAGGLSRLLLHKSNITVGHYFTHAQVIKTPPVDLELATIIMPAVQQRFILEAQAQQLEANSGWNPPYDEVAKLILDPGAVQFTDGSLCMGQISAIAPNPDSKLNPFTAETQIRQQLGNILPLLEEIPGSCHSCLVAFNNDMIALVGNLAHIQGLYLFSGFVSTFVFAPVLARRFASSVSGKEDKIIEQLQLVINS